MLNEFAEMDVHGLFSTDEMRKVADNRDIRKICGEFLHEFVSMDVNSLFDCTSIDSGGEIFKKFQILNI